MRRIALFLSFAFLTVACADRPLPYQGDETTTPSLVMEPTPIIHNQPPPKEKPECVFQAYDDDNGSTMSIHGWLEFEESQSWLDKGNPSTSELIFDQDLIAKETDGSGNPCHQVFTVTKLWFWIRAWFPVGEVAVQLGEQMIPATNVINPPPGGPQDTWDQKVQVVSLDTALTFTPGHRLRVRMWGDTTGADTIFRYPNDIQVTLTGPGLFDEDDLPPFTTAAFLPSPASTKNYH